MLYKILFAWCVDIIVDFLWYIIALIISNCVHLVWSQSMRDRLLSSADLRLLM